MIALGIDPGQTGGLALVSRDTNGSYKLLDAAPMPLASPTKKPTLDFSGWAWAGHDDYYDLGVIENVHSMPAQGVSSSFQFGRMFGAAEMLAQHYTSKQLYVTPQSWKKHFNLPADKYAAMALATRLFDTSKYWSLKKHDGVAEAALIAAYGLHKENNK